MGIEIDNYDGAFEVLDGLFKGRVVIKDLVSELEDTVFIHGPETVDNQVAKHLNQSGFHVVGIIICTSDRTIMIVKRK
jgi:hypothetical protein